MIEYDNLTEYNVSVLDESNGDGWRRAYSNSPKGREEIIDEYPIVADEIIGEDKKWGSEPTVIEETT